MPRKATSGGDDPRRVGYGFDINNDHKGHDVEFWRSLDELRDPAVRSWMRHKIAIQQEAGDTVQFYKAWMRHDLTCERTEPADPSVIAD